MAAADYYNTGGQSPAGPQPGPPRPPQQNSTLNPPYPLSDAPPPYSEFGSGPRPHSQPPPQHRPHPTDQYHPPPPPPPPSGQPPPNGYQYPPDKSGRPPGTNLQNMYRPSDFGGPYTPQPYQQPQQPPPQQYGQPQNYFPLAGTPAMQQVYGNGDMNGRRPSTTPGYKPPRSPYRDDSDRSRSRSRSRDRKKHRHHQHRSQPQRKKSSGVNTFLGAGGGAIIGDAIFPGLGTIGGALLGGLGGHEYGKKRASSNPARMKGRSYSNDGVDYGDDYRRGRKY